MDKKYHILQRIADQADLASEPLPGIPVVEIAGDRRVLIESHNGITGYDETEIRINVSFGQIQIRGKKLVISMMSKNTLIVSGIVEEICLLRSGKHDQIQ